MDTIPEIREFREGFIVVRPSDDVLDTDGLVRMKSGGYFWSEMLSPTVFDTEEEAEEAIKQLT